MRIALILVTILLCSCGRKETSGPLPQDVYLWQRVWKPGVERALEQAAPNFGSIVVLIGEVSGYPDALKPKVTRSGCRFAVLKPLRNRTGLAIRITAHPKEFRKDDPIVVATIHLAKEGIKEARGQGVEPVEVQIDFDCPESQLAGYRIWLDTIVESLKPMPVCPTVLPSWLKHGEFAKLVSGSGRYVLQVHSVEPPRELAANQKLTDPDQVLKWVEQASKVGVPFRVALPTYSYLVAQAADGKTVGISAEGPSAEWRNVAAVRRWEADPGDLARLIATWTRARPALLTGVLWYRLPVPEDTLNWRWITLAAVMRGTAPKRDLHLEVSSDQPHEILAVNAGEQDEPLPELVTAHWTDAKLMAVDALAGYEIDPAEAASDGSVRFRRLPEAALSRLSPGTRRSIGWIRCEDTPNIQLSMDRASDGDSRRSTPLRSQAPGDRH